MLLILAGCLVGSGSYIINYLLNLKAEKKSLDAVQEKVTVPEGNVSEEKMNLTLILIGKVLKKLILILLDGFIFQTLVLIILFAELLIMNTI